MTQYFRVNELPNAGASIIYVFIYFKLKRLCILLDKYKKNIRQKLKTRAYSQLYQ